MKVDVMRFLQEVRVELSRVEWPTYQDFVESLVVVFLVVFFFATFLGVVDRGLALVAKRIFIYGA